MLINNGKNQVTYFMNGPQESLKGQGAPRNFVNNVPKICEFIYREVTRLNIQSIKAFHLHFKCMNVLNFVLYYLDHHFNKIAKPKHILANSNRFLTALQN